MRGKWAIAVVCALLAGVAVGALSLLRQRTAEPAAAPSAQTAPAAASSTSLPGIIQAVNVTEAKSQVDGEIESFLVEVGEEVFEGQLLAQISNESLDAAVKIAAEALERAQERAQKVDAEILAVRLEASRARSDASRARGEFERAEKFAQRQQMLHREGASPRIVYEKAQKEAESAQTQFSALEELARQAEERAAELIREQQTSRQRLDEARLQLEEATGDLEGAAVQAPVTGIVVERRGEPGSQVGPDEESKVLFRIATDIGALRVVIEPAPADLARIRPGMPALVHVSGVQENYDGEVTAVQDGKATVTFNSPNPEIKPGMEAQVKIETRQE
jgi:multidrug resistance efflux pump